MPTSELLLEMMHQLASSVRTNSLEAALRGRLLMADSDELRVSTRFRRTILRPASEQNLRALVHGSSRRHAEWVAKMLTPTARDGHSPSGRTGVDSGPIPRAPTHRSRFAILLTVPNLALALERISLRGLLVAGPGHCPPVQISIGRSNAAAPCPSMQRDPCGEHSLGQDGQLVIVHAGIVAGTRPGVTRPSEWGPRPCRRFENGMGARR